MKNICRIKTALFQLSIMFSIFFISFNSCTSSPTGTQLQITADQELVPYIKYFKISTIQNNKVVWWRKYQKPFTFPIIITFSKGKYDSATFQVEAYTDSFELISKKSEEVTFENGQILNVTIHFECIEPYCEQNINDGGIDTVDTNETDLNTTDTENDTADDKIDSGIENQTPVNPGCDLDVQTNSFKAGWSIDENGKTSKLILISGKKYWTYDYSQNQFLSQNCGDILKFWETTTNYPQDMPIEAPWNNQDIINNGIQAAWTINITNTSTFLQISSKNKIWTYDLRTNQWIYDNNMSGTSNSLFQLPVASVEKDEINCTEETVNAPGYNSVYQQNGISSMFEYFSNSTNYFYLFSLNHLWMFYLQDPLSFNPIITCEYKDITDWFLSIHPNDAAICYYEDGAIQNPGCDTDVINTGIDMSTHYYDSNINIFYIQKGLKLWTLKYNQNNGWAWDPQSYIDNYPEYLKNNASPQYCPQAANDPGWCEE